MSITPYNNLTVRDLNGNQQSYVNSTTEVGYFTGEYSGTIPNGRVFSLIPFLKTNNGIASVDSTNGMFGLTILNSGVYKINLSLFPTSTQDGSSNISFNFGTEKMLLNDTSANVVSAFGGVSAIGMYTYDPSNNPSFPGIISWVADGYSSANSTISNFVQNPLTYELAYNYNNAGYSDKKLYSGISTTEMTFVVDSSVNIFLNVNNNSNTNITMGDCCFTLKLMTTPFTRVRTWIWRTSDAPVSTDWWAITSSASGQYLAAIASYAYPTVRPGQLYISSNYGANWITPTSGAGSRVWWGLTSSASGQYLAATIRDGPLRRSSNYGVDWIDSGPTPVTTNRSWRDITSSRDGSRLAAIAFGVGIFVSRDFGANWSLLTNSVTGARISMSESMQYFCVGGDGGGFFASTNGGSTWTQSNPATTNMFWTRIASSIDGKYVYTSNSATFLRSIDYGVNLVNGPGVGAQTLSQIATSSNGQYLAFATSQLVSGVYTSTNYGNTWTRQLTTGLPTASFSAIASSGDGSRLVTAVPGGSIWFGVFS